MIRRRWNYEIKSHIVCIFKNRQDTVRSNLCNYISIIHYTQHTKKYTLFNSIIHSASLSFFDHHHKMASTCTSFTKHTYLVSCLFSSSFFFSSVVEGGGTKPAFTNLP